MTKEKTSAAKKGERYFEGVGRRKTAVARVRISKGTGTFSVNGKKSAEYFNMPLFDTMASLPLEKVALTGKFNISAKVSGGGVNAQAEAVRLGLARALVIHDAELRSKLRTLGFLTRDPRMVERKKYGLKKARRAPQWKKR
ncbi:MAG TPA: 30S ribosomal protein S9 [Candidatus Paceibacterota bacterium]|nr:30S ribosomal protein S9 [Candidatus Paceibacterota bacterium]